MSPRELDSKGFTLVEILVVLIIFSLSVALIFPAVVSGIGKVGLKTSTRRVAATLEHTRNLALREREVYYAEALGDKVVVRTGASSVPAREIGLSSDTDVSAEKGSIAFFPGGDSTGGLFMVKSLRNDSFYMVMVEASTGRVRVSALK